MTREEAKSCKGTIEMLQRLAYNIHGVMDVIDADNCKKIIKALEQEPCEDAISRQAVLDLVNADWKYDGLEEPINSMPPVTPQEPKWIHVKDRLPIMGEDVLICDYDGDMYISYLHTDGKWGYDDGGNKLKNIIAWMPLPEPYKPQESENKE